MELTNPIFYLNLAGLLLATFAWWKVRSSTAPSWVAPMLVVVAIGTAIHFVGDLIDYPEDQDHVFIHGVVLVAVAIAGWGARRP